MSDPKGLSSSGSYAQGGTVRWMSPELIDPQRFGFQKRRPTISSDCYALGMVIYETISGNLPFHKHTDPTVIVKVLEGGRPLRGVRFTNSLWKMLELCWASQANDRPSIEGVLQCLEMVSNLSEPHFTGVDEGTEMDSDDSDSADDSSYVPNETSGRMISKRCAIISSGLSLPVDRSLSPTATAPAIVEVIAKGGPVLTPDYIATPNVAMVRAPDNQYMGIMNYTLLPPNGGSNMGNCVPWNQQQAHSPNYSRQLEHPSSRPSTLNQGVITDPSPCMAYQSTTDFDSRMNPRMESIPTLPATNDPVRMTPELDPVAFSNS